MHLVSYSDIREHVTLASTYAPVRASFKAYSDGTANIPPVQHLEMPYAANGALHIKSGHVRGHPLCIVKVASTFPSNPTRTPPLPSIGGVIVLFDLDSGAPVALLEDRAWITQARTASAGATAAVALAKRGSTTLGIVGTGTQARLQAQAITEALPAIDTIRIWGRNAEHAARCVDDLRAALPNGNVERMGSVAEVVDAAQIVVTATYATEPLVLREHVSSDKLIIGVGSDAPYKCELDPHLIAGADFVVVDSRPQNEHLGDISRGIASGIFGSDRINAELGQVLSEIDNNSDAALASRIQKARAGGTTIVKLTGIASQEAFVCNALAERLGLIGLTQRKEEWHGVAH